MKFHQKWLGLDHKLPLDLHLQPSTVLPCPLHPARYRMNQAHLLTYHNRIRHSRAQAPTHQQLHHRPPRSCSEAARRLLLLSPPDPRATRQIFRHKRLHCPRIRTSMAHYLRQFSTKTLPSVRSASFTTLRISTKPDVATSQSAQNASCRLNVLTRTLQNTSSRANPDRLRRKPKCWYLR